MTAIIVLMAAFWGLCNGYVWKDIESTGNHKKEFREDVGRTLPGRLFYFPIWIWTTFSKKEEVAE